MSNTTKNSVKTQETKTNKTVSVDTKKDNEIAELKKMIELLQKQNEMLSSKIGYAKEDKEVEVNPTRMIKVISLCSNELNLSQYEYGQGKVYKFPRIGTSRSIPANILDDVVTSHLSLAEKGYFYICDSEFIREHGLEEDYKNIKDFNIIDTILENDKETLQEVLSSCKLEQLDTILDVIIGKVNNGSISLESLSDSGKESIINKIYSERTGKDYSLSETIKDIKELTNPSK